MRRRDKPILIYDGDCGFCRRWILRWNSLTRDAVDYAPYQEVQKEFPEITLKQFQSSVQLVEPNGEITSGAESVYRSLAYAQKKWPYWMYRNVPGCRPLSDRFYQVVARNRSTFSALTKLFWGNDLAPPTFAFSTWLFLRLLGIVYLIAFWSLAVQIVGLVGDQGILPARLLLEDVARQTSQGRFWVLPTLFWLNSSDVFLYGLAIAGAVLSVVLVAGLFELPILFLLWAFYLSLLNVGSDFLRFQWDSLLLETGFLSIFLVPLTLKWSRKATFLPPKIIHWLFRLLLFRLMFSSGVVKLASGDPTWRSLTALRYHYETQPLPTRAAWYFHQLPGGFQDMSNLLMFFIELLLPFLIFGPKHLRVAAAAGLIFFQILIFITGNYCFFNLLAIALCVLLLDDSVWPKRWRDHDNKTHARRPKYWSKFVQVPLAGFTVLMSSLQLTALFSWSIQWPAPIVRIIQASDPFFVVNSYGLFAVMTTTRSEIIIEGSSDSDTWLPYEFKYKPGDLKRAPMQVAPYQPRLDWQMWFAALGNYKNNPWFLNFMVRLLQGSPEVLKLLETNPFPERPPRYIRATLYRYRFTDFATRSREGTWWRRDRMWLYIPPLSLSEQNNR
jgi:predicted DCC family thiol-disulfide oxidoreductase YuxK